MTDTTTTPAAADQQPPAPAGPTVIGVDLSYTGAGIAVWRDGLWTFASVKTPSDMPHEDRWAEIGRALWRRLRAHCLVVIETPLPMKGTVALDLGMLHGAIRSGLYGRHAAVGHVQVPHLKQFATGSGNAAKQEMLDTARARLGVSLYSDDQADAAWLAAAGLHRFGRPLCATTKVQDEAVRKSVWPAWSADPAEWAFAAGASS